MKRLGFSLTAKLKSRLIMPMIAREIWGKLDFELLAEAWINWGGSRQRAPQTDKIAAKELIWIACVVSEGGKRGDPQNEQQRQVDIFASLSQLLRQRFGSESWVREKMFELVVNEVHAELFDGGKLRPLIFQALVWPVAEDRVEITRSYKERCGVLARARLAMAEPNIPWGLVNDSMGMLRVLPGVIDDALAGMRAFHERDELSAAARDPSVLICGSKSLRM